MGSGPYAHVAGFRFPGGRTVVPRWMNQLWCDAVCSPDTTPDVHPMLVYYAAVQGSGVDFDTIFDLMDASVESGVMVGEQRFRFARALAVGKPYDVRGGMTSVERKAGRRAGVFDIATFELELRDPDGGAQVATSATSFVFPRRDAS